jgi:hypothetical protein
MLRSGVCMRGRPGVISAKVRRGGRGCLPPARSAAVELRCIRMQAPIATTVGLFLVLAIGRSRGNRIAYFTHLNSTPWLQRPSALADLTAKNCRVPRTVIVVNGHSIALPTRTPNWSSESSQC